MTDKEAIEALTDKDVVNPYLTLEALEIAIDALKERAERKTGKWKPIDLTFGRHFYYCTVCEKSVRDPIVNGELEFEYCPKCGVKMEVTE